MSSRQAESGLRHLGHLSRGSLEASRALAATARFVAGKAHEGRPGFGQGWLKNGRFGDWGCIVKKTP